MTAESTAVAPRAFREPANQVSPKAVTMWRLTESLEFVASLVAVGAAYWWFRPWPWWGVLIAAAVISFGLVGIAVAPAYRYRFHRWEVSPIAVFTRTGWLSLETRIAPLSRVQTVDVSQGPLQRIFGLASVVVTTASSAGAVTVAHLDEIVARRVVAELTEITAATEGDAT
jgi:uncharacterized protein